MLVPGRDGAGAPADVVVRRYRLARLPDSAPRTDAKLTTDAAAND